ncbi:MAG: hypothetical protein WCK55_03195 [Verrucomicrobiota bacterium]
MTHLQRIETHLTSHPGLCDDCLAEQLHIHPRQTVNGLCRKAGNRIVRQQNNCAGCSEMKAVNLLSTEPTSATSTRTPKVRKPKSRNQDLRTQLNQALIAVFPLEERDYYAELSFAQLLQLKQGLARIHDTVTLKLTFELVNWIAHRFHLSSEDAATLRKQVDDQSANAAGFDLQWNKPHLIGEVKGCIPVNQGKTFGAAQINSLTNDVLQMLGHPARGKDKEKLSKNTKVNRENREHAIKILGLYDAPEVKAATAKWRGNLMESKTWEPLKAFTILDMPENGDLSPNAVYLVYLNPTHASSAATAASFSE